MEQLQEACTGPGEEGPDEHNLPLLAAHTQEHRTQPGARWMEYAASAEQEQERWDPEVCVRAFCFVGCTMLTGMHVRHQEQVQVQHLLPIQSPSAFVISRRAWTITDYLETRMEQNGRELVRYSDNSGLHQVCQCWGFKIKMRSSQENFPGGHYHLIMIIAACVSRDIAWEPRTFFLSFHHLMYPDSSAIFLAKK